MITALLKQRLRLERLQPGPDGRGGWQEDWILLHEGPGRLRPLSGRSLELAGRLHAEARYVLYLPPGPVLRVGDRVMMAGRAFRVLVTGLGEEGHHEKLLLREESDSGAAP